MAIPLLIGAAVAVVGVAAAVAASDDNDSGYRDYEEDDREEQQREKNKKDLKAYTRRQVNSLAKRYGIEDKDELEQILQGDSLDSLNLSLQNSGLGGLFGGVTTINGVAVSAEIANVISSLKNKKLYNTDKEPDEIEALWVESESYKEKEKELEQQLTQLDTLNQAAKALEKL